MIEQTIKVNRKAGLDARAISQIAEVASRFRAELFLNFKGHTVNLKSIMGVLSLGIPDQAEITLTASGRDEGKALQQLIQTVENLG